MYRRFRTNGHAKAQAIYRILIQGNTLQIDGETIHVDSPEALLDQAYERVLDAVIARVRSHLLIHAGVVSWQGKGLVFPAYSGHGKTTLVLELVKRGFRFLSDEIAAFERHTGRLAPFPRSLRVRPGTLALCGLPDLPAPSWRDKRIVDIERLLPRSLGGLCTPNALIVLGSLSGGESALDAALRTLYLVPERITPALLNALRRIDGLQSVSPVPSKTAAVLRIQARTGAPITPVIKRTCQAHGIQLIDLIKGGMPLPDFEASPHLMPISPAEAAMDLVRRFRGGQDSALLQKEHGGNAAHLFLEMAEMVSGLDCYRLSVGRLDQTADLICKLINAPMNPTEVSP